MRYFILRLLDKCGWFELENWHLTESLGAKVAYIFEFTPFIVEFQSDCYFLACSANAQQVGELHMRVDFRTKHLVIATRHEFEKNCLTSIEMYLEARGFSFELLPVIDLKI